MARNTEKRQFQPDTDVSGTPEAAALQLLISKREIFLLHLLSGHYFLDEAHLLLDAQDAGITFQHPNYLVVSARVEAWGTLYSRSREETMEVNFILRNLMEHAIADSYGVAYCGKVAFIINTAEHFQDDMPGLKQRLLELTELLEREFQLTVSFTVSRVRSCPLELSDAWEETESVFEYRDVLEEDFVVSTVEDLNYSHMLPAQDAYMELTTRLLASIRQADYEGIRQVFHAIIDNEFSAAHPTVEIFRFRIYGVVDQLLYLMNCLRNTVGNELIDHINPGPRLTRKQPITQLLQEIDSILDELTAMTSQQPSTVFPVWVEQVHNYILENFRDPGLYVAQVADHFHVSSTYCSKLFRERYGVRMFDFIQLRRMEAAKQLLGSGISLKEISTASGFSSALTMSRAFKRYEGSNPSTYKI